MNRVVGIAGLSLLAAGVQAGGEADFSSLAGFQEQLAAARAVSVRPIVRRAEESGGPGIFCSIPLPMSHTRPDLDARWGRAQAERLEPDEEPWAGLLSALRGRPARSKLDQVNSWVNARVHYLPGSHSRTASETIRAGRGGWEDQAYAKLQLLRAAGFPAEDLFVSLVFDPVAHGYYALVVARLNGRYLVLDNRSDRVTEDSPALDYRPTFSYGVAGKWIHGFAPGYKPGDACPLGR